MMNKAGANSVTVLPRQDFLAINPHNEKYSKVTHLLLDPSCSGSGIVGREDIPSLALPASSSAHKATTQRNGDIQKKRKRDDGSKEQAQVKESDETEETKDIAPDAVRLQRLSALQTRIVVHALSFPAATRITYSTCSLHREENESVVESILASDVAKSRGWRVLKRDEQVDGLRRWRHRGIEAVNSQVTNPATDPSTSATLTEEERDACIRCFPGDEEGTMGFFLCGFYRPQEDHGGESNHFDAVVDPTSEEGDWHGFGD
jgi:putative methyltransferase